MVHTHDQTNCRGAALTVCDPVRVAALPVWPGPVGSAGCAGLEGADRAECARR